MKFNVIECKYVSLITFNEWPWCVFIVIVSMYILYTMGETKLNLSYLISLS